MRLTRSVQPVGPRRLGRGSAQAPCPSRVRLSHFIAQHAGRRMDLDVEFERGRAPTESGSASSCCRATRDDDLAVHQSASHAVLARPRRTTLPVPLADRAAVQGVEVVRQPAQVRHRERAHRRRTDLGEPVRGGPQALPGPRGAARRWHGDLDASRRHVRAITSSTSSSRHCSPASASRAAFATGLPFCSRTRGVRTPSATARPAAYGAGLASRRPLLSDHL